VFGKSLTEHLLVIKRKKLSVSKKYSHLNFMDLVLSILFLLSLISSPASAAVSNTFNYQGRLMDSAGTNPISGPVVFRIGIYNPAENCLLYEESQTVSPSSLDGFFSLKIGSEQGNTKRTTNDPNLSLPDIFKNQGQIIGSGCTYNPQSLDSRKLKVTLTLQNQSPYDLPFQEILSSPTAIVSETLQGKVPSDFVLKSEVGLLSGPAGPQGIPGQNGTNGNTWLAGSGSPTALVGTIGDFYLDTSNGFYYKKVAIGWSSLGSLIGPKGDNGSDGVISVESPLEYDSLNKSISLGVVPISKGGTGGITSAQALSNLLPSQAGNSGKYLSTNGIDVFWSAVAGGSGSVSSSSDITDFVEYPLQITATTTNPVLPTNTNGISINKAVARYVGDTLEVMYKLELGSTVSGGSNGSGLYLFSLPGNLEIDFTKLGTTGTQNRVVGKAYTFSGGASRDALVSVKTDYTNKLILMFEASGTTPSELSSGNYPSLGGTSGIFTSASTALSFEARIPIRGKTTGVTPDFNISLPTGTLPVVSGLFSHFNAGSLNLADQASISSWEDSSQSTGAQPLTQATAVNQPKYALNSINGLPAVRSDGVNDYMTTSRSIPAISTVFLVSKPLEVTTTDSKVFYRSDVAGTSPKLQVGKRNGTKLYHYSVTSGGSGVSTDITSAQTNKTDIAQNEAFVSTMVSNSTKLVGYLNGTQAYSYTNYGGGSSNGITLFASTPTPTSYINADIAELIIYNRELTISEIQQVNLYLKNKYGIE
jgi:Concanavalin A-like lectin/glucanases superfamily